MEGIGAEEGERITYQEPVAHRADQEVCGIVRSICAAGCGMLAMLQAGTYLLHCPCVEVKTDVKHRRALVEQDCPMPQEGLNVHRMGGHQVDKLLVHTSTSFATTVAALRT
jgi:hypothetical protein